MILGDYFDADPRLSSCMPKLTEQREKTCQITKTNAPKEPGVKTPVVYC